MIVRGRLFGFGLQLVYFCVQPILARAHAVGNCFIAVDRCQRSPKASSGPQTGLEPRSYRLPCAVNANGWNRSGEDARGVLHAAGHLAQMMQRVAERHFKLSELLEVVAHDVLVSHTDTSMQLHRLLAHKTH